MPPKKKGSKSPGKKRRSSSRKRSSSKNKLIIQLDESESALPVVSNSRHQALSGAVIASDVQSLSRMVTHYHYGDVLNATDFNGSTPLHIACRKGDWAMCEKILSFSKTDVNLPEKTSAGGYSALHHACAIGSLKIVELLLNNGADMHLKADSALGERPLHTCCKNGKLEVAQYLIYFGVQPDLRDNFGHNASYWAIQMQHEDMLVKLNLPQSKAATAQEYLAILMEKNKGYVLPPISKSRKGKKGRSKSPGKKKK